MLVTYRCTFQSRLCGIILKIMCNDEYPLLSGKYHLATFNSELKQATFVNNRREYYLYYKWVLCYQWHLLHAVFSVYYFFSEFTILRGISFKTPCIFLTYHLHTFNSTSHFHMYFPQSSCTQTSLSHLY